MHSSKDNEIGKDTGLSQERAPDGLRAYYGPIPFKAVAAACAGRHATACGAELKKPTSHQLWSLQDRGDHQD